MRIEPLVGKEPEVTREGEESQLTGEVVASEPGRSEWMDYSGRDRRYSARSCARRRNRGSQCQMNRTRDSKNLKG